VQLTKKIFLSVLQRTHTELNYEWFQTFPLFSPDFPFQLQIFHEAFGFSRVSRIYAKIFARSGESSDFNVCLVRREPAQYKKFLYFCGWMYCFLSSNISFVIPTFVSRKGLEMYQTF
jgi:hypothetical protein